MALSVDIKSRLENFNLHMSFTTESKRIGILGESGSGKSMLLKYIAGIFSPDSGIITLQGEELYNSEKKINVIPQKRDIAYMFQNYALFPHMTIRENIEIIIRGTKEEQIQKANRLMGKFSIDNLADKYPSQLSGGQQQRVALARIMAYEPKVILLDEPFSALDLNLKEKMQVELEEMLKDYEGTVIMVSHSKTEIFKFSDELMVINGGKIVEHGKTKDIFVQPNTKEGARMIGISNIIGVSLKGNVLDIPDWNISLTLDNSNKPEHKAPRYIGVRAKHLKILEPGEIGENPISIQVESIYEGIEELKIFFTIMGEENHLLDEEAKIYVLRLPKKGNYRQLVKDKILRLDFNKKNIIFIEDRYK